jgi:hypothetical protein
MKIALMASPSGPECGQGDLCITCEDDTKLTLNPSRAKNVQNTKNRVSHFRLRFCRFRG